MRDSARRGTAGPGSFGHDGLGRNLDLTHPTPRIAFAYQTVRPGGVPADRAEALCCDLHDCM